MPDSKVRVAGGGNTYIAIGDEGGSTAPIKFMARANETPGTALTQPVDIIPVGSMCPEEIVPPVVQSSGTLVCTVWQLWGKEAIATALENTSVLGGSTNANNLVNLYEVFEQQRKAGNRISVKKFERAGSGETDNQWRVITYNNAVVTNVSQNETFESRTMEMTVDITIKYTDRSVQYLTVADRDTARGLAY
jgi:hypothetical protein